MPIYNYLLDEVTTYVVNTSNASIGGQNPLTYYASQSTQMTEGTNTFVGFVPDDPDVTTSFYEYEGRDPEYVFGAGNSLPVITRPHLQIVCRDQYYEYARDQCESVVRLLEQIVNQQLSAATGQGYTLYYRINRIQDPFLFSRDKKRRVYFACNMDVERQPS